MLHLWSLLTFIYKQESHIEVKNLFCTSLPGSNTSNKCTTNTKERLETIQFTSLNINVTIADHHRIQVNQLSSNNGILMSLSPLHYHHPMRTTPYAPLCCSSAIKGVEALHLIGRCLLTRTELPLHAIAYAVRQPEQNRLKPAPRTGLRYLLLSIWILCVIRIVWL